MHLPAKRKENVKSNLYANCNGNLSCSLTWCCGGWCCRRPSAGEGRCSPCPPCAWRAPASPSSPPGIRHCRETYFWNKSSVITSPGGYTTADGTFRGAKRANNNIDNSTIQHGVSTPPVYRGRWGQPTGVCWCHCALPLLRNSPSSTSGYQGRDKIRNQEIRATDFYAFIFMCCSR